MLSPQITLIRNNTNINLTKWITQFNITENISKYQLVGELKISCDSSIWNLKLNTSDIILITIYDADNKSIQFTMLTDGIIDTVANSGIDRNKRIDTYRLFDMESFMLMVSFKSEYLGFNTTDKHIQKILKTNTNITNYIFDENSENKYHYSTTFNNNLLEIKDLVRKSIGYTFYRDRINFNYLKLNNIIKKDISKTIKLDDYPYTYIWDNNFIDDLMDGQYGYIYTKWNKDSKENEIIYINPFNAPIAYPPMFNDVYNIDTSLINNTSIQIVLTGNKINYNYKLSDIWEIKSDVKKNFIDGKYIISKIIYDSNNNLQIILILTKIG